MYFDEYSEFIHAFYSAYYSSYDEKIKNKILDDVYNEYLESDFFDSQIDNLFLELKNQNFEAQIDYDFLEKYNGRIFSIQELLVKKVKIHYLVASQYVQKILTLKNNKCLQCGNKKDFFSYQNSFSQVTYCKKCLHLGISDNINFKFIINYPNKIDYSGLNFPNISLSSEQDKASKKLLENIKVGKNSLVWAVCGAGKTEIIYETLFYSLKLGKKVCIAIPRKDIVKELALRIKKDFALDINILHGDEKILLSSSIYIMTTHQLTKYYKFFDLVIVDEVDAFPYNSDSILEYGLEKSLIDKANIIFLSATPSKKIKNFVDDIFKIPIRYHKHLLPLPKISCEKDRLENFIAEIKSTSRRALIFVADIKTGKELAKKLNFPFVSSKEEKRNEILENFYNKKFNILITTTILERGVTFDYLDVLVFDASHIHFTKEALIQIAGRVGRKDYDTSGQIIFFADKKTKNMTSAIKEIKYMNALAKYRKLNIR
ncbi:helicase-related protein [Gemella sp. zg-1178]|uniref:helicase-related protein n=1 Tax=Gemella sp. zg-1178 TaxID=2840372 RepID=UPI001C058736|nr:helicase-related protein [Gemella sp. zg-1178]MBU0278877.1 DEAD/DEAH box helicase family protein [Gemella sp. zg-1178]